MPTLTEDMIIARTKTSELGTVKKLNCWGSDLTDVSLVKRLTNVEVLSLSLNKITTLSDFQYCRNLVELYVRRNAIRDLSELCYLQDLPRLRRLLLAENPCVDTAGPLYRATVLRCLPNLEVLDNDKVTPEEVDQAMRVGLILEHPLAKRERGESPDSAPTYYREDTPPPAIQQPPRRHSSAVDEEAFNRSNLISRSPPPDYSPYIQHEEKERRSPEQLPAPANSATNPNDVMHRSSSLPSGGSGTDEMAPSPPLLGNPTNNNNPNAQADLPPGMRKIQRSPPQDYHPQPHHEVNVNGGGNYGPRRPSSDYLQDVGRGYQEPYYEDSPSPQHRNLAPVAALSQQRFSVPNSRSKSRSKTSNDVMQQNPTGPRSSNLLSAVLCLIPELDWQSLEVVELAIRRRMDELVSD